MKAKDVIIDQLVACHENTWFVSLLNSIDGLTDEQANWKPNESTNSIFEIVNHLIFYNERILNRIKDIPNEAKDHSNTFHNKNDLTWNEAVLKITDIMSELKKVVDEADSDTFEGHVEVLTYITIHTTYHTGQIIYIRKLQDSWNPGKGVEG